MMRRSMTCKWCMLTIRNLPQRKTANSCATIFQPSAIMRALPLLIVLATLSSACGYKGPLYLPKPKPEVQKPAPPAPQQEEKKPDA